MFAFSLEYTAATASNAYNIVIPSEDSMAAIWVIFGHLAIIPKKEKWPADIRPRTRDPKFACPNSNY